MEDSYPVFPSTATASDESKIKPVDVDEMRLIWFANQATEKLPIVVMPAEEDADVDGEIAFDSLTGKAIERSDKKLARNTFVAVGTRILTYGVSIPLSIVTSRLLGPQDKGIYTLFLLVLVFYTYMTFNISSAGIFFVGKKHYTLRQVVANLVTFGILLAVVVDLVYVVLAFFVHIPVLSDFGIGVLLIIGFIGPINIWSTYLEDCLLAAQDIVGYNITSNIVQTVAQAGTFVVLVLVNKNLLADAIESYALGVLISFFVTIALLSRHVRFGIGWDIRLWGKMFNFGIKGYLTAILNLGNQRLDTILVSLIVSVTALGYYSVSASLSEMTWQLPLVISSVLFPTTAALTAKQGAKISAQVCRRIILVQSAIIIALIIAAPELVTFLYGHTFAPAVLPLQTLLPGALGYTIYKTLYSYLLGNGKPSSGIWSTGISLTVTVVLDLLLIPRLGIEGAAITSSIAYCLNGLVILIAFVSDSHLHPLEAVIPTLQDVSALFTQVFGQVRSLQRRIQGVLYKHDLPAPGKGPSQWSLLFGLGGASLILLVGVLLKLNATIVLLAIIGMFAFLSFVNRLWIGIALIAADMTLTDYPITQLDGLSLRVVLSGIALFVFLLAFARGQLTFNRPARITLISSACFLGVATAMNMLNGGDTQTFLDHMLVGIVLIIYLAYLIQSKRDVQFVAVACLSVALLSAVVAIGQHSLHLTFTVGSPGTLAAYAGRSFGLSQTPIMLSNVLAVAAAGLACPLLLNPYSRFVKGAGLLVILVLVIGIYLSGSRSGLISVYAALFVLAFGIKWKFRPLLLMGMLVIGIVGSIYVIGGKTDLNLAGGRTVQQEDITSGERLILWDAAVHIILDHPLTGIGYNQFAPTSVAYIPQVTTDLQGAQNPATVLGNFPPHNDFLNFMVSFGLLGLLLFVWLHVLTAVQAWSIWKNAEDQWIRSAGLGCLAALAAYFCYEMLHNGFEDSLTLWIIIGLTLGLFQARFAKGQFPRLSL